MSFAYSMPKVNMMVSMWISIKKRWDFVKQDLFELLKEFHKGNLDLARLNYGIITLVPKGNDADKIKKCRMICLLNVSLKIITKMLVNSFTQVIWG
jgi:hypothetical protein